MYWGVFSPSATWLKSRSKELRAIMINLTWKQGSQSCEMKYPACPLVSLTHLGIVWAAHWSCYRAGLLALAAVSRFYQEAWLVSVAARPPARALRRLISPGAAPVVIARKVILDKLTCKCLLLFPRWTPQPFHWVKQLWIRFKVAADLLVAGILGPQVRCEM